MILSSVRRLALTAALMAMAAGSVAAQTTLTLTQSDATTLRGGVYANTNFNGSGVLETRASSDPTYIRRALFKFDTNTTLAAGTPIQSAILTVTVAGGNPETRTLSAFNEPSSYDQAAATWTRRKSSMYWAEQGGDTGSRYATASVANGAGTKVKFDVTALVRAVVRGDFGSSRYTRILLVDEGGSSRDSYKQYYSDTAGDPSTRPTLTIVTGTSTTSSGSTSTPPPPPTTTTTSSLRVLQWNTHHGGYRTDGVYDINLLATWIAKMQPDIVSLNEIERFTGWGNEDQPARIASLLQSKTGKTWYYKFASVTGAATGNGNLILSRFPFVSSTSHLLSYTRVVVQAAVSVNGRTINFFSTHLDDASSSYRLTEISQLKSWAGGFAQQRIVAGDFNFWPGAGEYSSMSVDHYDAWAEAAKKGTAVAYSGNTAGNTRNSRIDYVWYSKSATLLSLVSAQVYDTRDASGVMPSDHRPLVAVYKIN
jgi:endonuclease/exonuclease/phosphatase family metal-dependent hydrolase